MIVGRTISGRTKASRALVAIAAVIAVMASVGMAPASANEQCDLMLSADVDGASIVGNLNTSVISIDNGVWIYTVTAPGGHFLEWFDGAFPVADAGDGMQIGGGVATREPVVTGEFTHLSACFTKTAVPTFFWDWIGNQSVTVLV